MGSALEAPCGQAFGAKPLHMLGVYMQRSWVILTAMCVFLLPIYLFASPLLQLLNQDKKISMLAGKFSALRIRIQFSDTKVLTGPEQGHDHGHSLSSGHGVPYILELASDGSLQVGSCGCSCVTQLGLVDCGAWSVCLYCCGGTALVLGLASAGGLSGTWEPLSSSLYSDNLFGWVLMVFLGFNAAISVRISNELGAGRPRAAKFSTLVVVMSSLLLGLFFFTLVFGMQRACSSSS